jgi:hypothetical protein
MSDEQPTPLPWKLGPTQDTVDDANGNELLELQHEFLFRTWNEAHGECLSPVPLPYAANAAFIVRAVNNHTALVEALKEAQRLIRDEPPEDWPSRSFRMIADAIANAEEQP